MLWFRVYCAWKNPHITPNIALFLDAVWKRFTATISICTHQRSGETRQSVIIHGEIVKLNTLQKYTDSTDSERSMFLCRCMFLKKPCELHNRALELLDREERAALAKKKNHPAKKNEQMQLLFTYKKLY